MRLESPLLHGERCIRTVPPTVIERIGCHIAHTPRALPSLGGGRSSHEPGLEQEAALVQLLVAQRQMEVSGDGIRVLTANQVADRLLETVRT